MMENVTRFSGRAGDYASHRPGYPTELEDLIRSWGPGKAADLGCGTGIFSRSLLRAGWTVSGVEPNADMAGQAGDLSREESRFTLFSGTAEATGLPTSSVDLTAAAQAFHWFDPLKCRKEMERILSPGGRILLVWNTRSLTDPFGKAYEQLMLKYWPQGEPTAHHRDWDENRLRSWFIPRIMETRTFDFPQKMTWERLRGRLASTSYAPLPGTETWNSLEKELKDLFDGFQAGGLLTQENTTRVYWG